MVYRCRVVLITYGSIFAIADIVGCWQRFKLQPNVKADPADLWRYLINTVYVYTVMVTPINVLTAVYAPAKVLPREAPSVLQFSSELLMLLVAMDTGYFLYHYAHHQDKRLYKEFHAIHHEATATSVLVAQHLSLVEFAVTAVLSVVPSLILGTHPMTNLVWYALSVVLSIDGHCGYDLPFHPFAPLVWAGILGGARHHDLHHFRPNTNLAPFLTFWDRAMGTFNDGTQLRKDQFLLGQLPAAAAKDE